jgi:hypothetical protein
LGRQALQIILKPVNSQLQDCECQTLKTVRAHKRQGVVYVEVRNVEGRRSKKGDLS